MRTLDRYILKELAIPLFIGTVAVVLMFLANTLIAYSNLIFKKEIPFMAVGQYLLFKIPQTLNLTLPVGVTIASALAVSRLARESELTAMRAAGISVRRVLIPVIAVGALVSIASFFLSETVTPKAEARALRTIRNVLASAEAVGIQSNVLLKLNAGEYNASVGVVRKGANGEVLMHDILIFSKPKRGEDYLVQASLGSYKDGILTLTRPVIWQPKGDEMFFAKPERFQINVRASLEDFFGQQQPESLTAAALQKTIRNWKDRGQDTRSFEVDYQNKFAIPASCFIFSLFSPILALIFARGGAFIGVLVSIIVVFLYYNMWVITSQVMSKQWILPPVIGAWLPNLLFLLAGLIALWRVE